ncbi:MAG: cadmium-translocating P-type ATPase [Christensenellaceae bacterium]|nr:cadmium-translocating P-type ATPase [Christensenellaceae bacterium]
MSNNSCSSCGCSSCGTSPNKVEKFIAKLGESKYLFISFIAIALSLFLPLFKMPWGVHFAWISIVLSGIPLFYSGFTNLFVHRKIKSTLLISTAMIASVAIGEVFAAGEIAFIMALGGFLEDITVSKAKDGIKTLMKHMPDGANVLDGNKEVWYRIDDIVPGMNIRLRPGEIIPVDGIVVRGNSAIDQSSITGESLPVDVAVDSNVYSGTVNLEGSIDIVAQKSGKDSSIQKMLDLIQMAEKSKAPIENLADKWAAWLVPIALIIAIFTYIFTKNITRAVTVLVVFCPCALALATPTAVVASIGRATKKGILIKSKHALELLSKIKHMAFDKTGTLTRAKIQVSDIISLNSDINEKEILKLAASLEVYSEHPLGKAIYNHAKNNYVGFYDVFNFKAITGYGVEGYINDTFYSVGKAVNIPEKYNSYLNSGKAVIALNKNDEAIGYITLADTLKPKAASTINELRNLGVESILLTGDNELAAKNIADSLNISNVQSNLLPTEKLEAIQKLKAKHGLVAMVGDGMNDAPALKSADVSIAMADIGSDVSVEAADIALLGDDISKLPFLKRLANKTFSTIRLNLSMAMIINFAAIALSISGILNPVTGALVHNAGSVLVVMNAAMLYKKRI